MSSEKRSMNVVRISKYAILIVGIFLIGFLSGRFVDIPGFSGGYKSEYVITGDKQGEIKSIDFDLFWRVWNTLGASYVDASKIDEQKMFYGAIKGLVNSFDDSATIFLDPDDTESFNEGNAGKFFEGIGAELGYENGQIVVIAPLTGSPAQKAGIKSGDVILKVDGEDIKPSETIYDVVQKIRGEAGSDVVLTILHKGALQVEEITITRSKITVPSMEVKVPKEDSSLIMIDLGRFTDESLGAWQKAWDGAVSEVVNSDAKGLILDLRGNPGGYFDAAIYAANEFLPKGTVVSMQEDRQGDRSSYKVTRNGKLLDIPVVILVDGGSASASEILAGALQKNERAVVVGENTYGKGTAQSIIPFSNGSSLHITVYKWLLPDGVWLNRDNPIKPDFVVELTVDDITEGDDLQLQKAVEILKK